MTSRIAPQISSISPPPQMTSRNRVPVVAVSLGILGFIAVIAALTITLTKPPPVQPTVPAVAMTVTKAVATKVQWPETTEASGPIAAWQEAIISSELSGQHLTEVCVDVGDQVKKGQVLARFNTDTLGAQQAELQADAVKDESDLQRGLSLQKIGGTSDQQVESYRDTAAVAEAKLNEQNIQLAYATVTAPADGVISSRTATLGATMSTGGELFRLILNNRLEWRGQLNASQMTRVTPGQGINLTLPDGETAAASVRILAPSLDVQSRLVTVYADIVPASHARAGMYASGLIALGIKKVLILPAVSVVLRDGRNYVFKLGDRASVTEVAIQEVTTGIHRGKDVEIITGLQEGDQMVAQGAGFLNDGDRVRVVDQKENNP